MAYLPPTISDFKGQFVRDFPYATPLSPKGVVGASVTPVLTGDKLTSITVNSGGSGYKNPSVVIYGGGGVGAQAMAVLAGGAIGSITITNQGFGYTALPQVYIAEGDNTADDKVTDWDLARAFTAALQFNITQGFFGSQQAYTFAVNLLAAHYLCTQLQSGVSGLHGQADWITAAKTAGNVTESFNIPARILRSPILSRLSKTTYGAQFVELVSAQLIGNVQSFFRDALP